MGLFGGGKTITYDKDYNRRMATVAEAQQRLADESWGYFKEMTLPYEREVMKTNLELLPRVGEYQKKAITEALASFDEERELRGEQRRSAIEGLEGQRQVRGSFLGELSKGPQTEERMRSTQADVSQAYKSGEEELGRTAGRMGISGDSSSMVDAIARMKTDKSKAIAGGRTMARNAAEADYFSKLSSGMQLFGGAGGEGSRALTAGPTPPSVPGASQNFAGNAMGMYGQTANTMGKMTANIKSEDNVGIIPGIMGTIGGLMGMAGAGMGMYKGMG